MATIRNNDAGILSTTSDTAIALVGSVGSIFRIVGVGAEALEYSVDNWAQARMADSDANALVANEVRDYETMAQIAERTEEAAKRCASIPDAEKTRIRELIAARKAARS